MYTSFALLALAGFLAPADVKESPSWLSNYTEARKLGEKEQKPIAVFIGTGEAGWQKLCSEGKIGSEAEQLLKQKYVCLYVNTATKHGQQLATAFEMADNLGIVISDATGRLQAFRHEGDLVRGDLVRYLNRYSDPTRQVRTTETNPSVVTTSYYQGSGTGQSYAPVSGGRC